MNAPLMSVALPPGAQPLLPVSPAWRVATPGVMAEKKMSALGFGVFAVVLFAHLAAFALLITQTLSISTPEPAQSGTGPLRVRLVSSKPEPAVAQTPVQPPRVTETKKILSSEAPSPRVVEAPKPEPVPVVPASVTPPPPTPSPATPAPAAPAAPSPALTAGKPSSLDLGSAPKEVGQIECRIAKPEYPRSARRRGEVGTVMIRLTVDERGQVSVALERSSGFPDLDASARQTAAAAQCKPFIEGGRAIRVTALQPFNFVPSD